MPSSTSKLRSQTAQTRPNDLLTFLTSITFIRIPPHASDPANHGLYGRCNPMFYPIPPLSASGMLDLDSFIKRQDVAALLYHCPRFASDRHAPPAAHHPRAATTWPSIRGHYCKYRGHSPAGVKAI